MLYFVKSFNQPLNSWNVSNVYTITCMFGGAKSFNQPLNDWDVSNVENMVQMFDDASSFNQPLDRWDVSKVKDMTCMFYGATSFRQPVTAWKLRGKQRGVFSSICPTTVIWSRASCVLPRLTGTIGNMNFMTRYGFTARNTV